MEFERTSDISELKFDKKNFNKHTPEGMGLLEKSLNKFGAGRSILVDKDNNIIAGNGIVEAAASAGITKTRVIETTGDELVVVKRKDVELDSHQGREMALADNATASADLEWDEELLRENFTDKELDEWDVDIAEDEQTLEADELSEISPLPQAYDKGDDVDHLSFDMAVEYDDGYGELEKKAEACENPELKKLLKRRLKDFADFKFDYIADYYLSGASDAERELMEDFGLVIPCERKALELGIIDLERTVLLGGGWSKMIHPVIIATEPGGKTARCFERIGLAFDYVVCECQKDRFVGEKAIFYPCSGKHGCNIARRRALEIADSVVFDDDYGGISALGMADSEIKPVSYKTAEALADILEGIKFLEKTEPKVILGGYSGGSLSAIDGRTKQNIMQIFFGGKITRFFRPESNLYRNNDDVCACIMAKHRGFATIGLWSLIRSGQQTAEGDDNTNNYGDRGFTKSYLAVLYAPTSVSIVWVGPKKLKTRTTTGRFHHLVKWAKITPKMVERTRDGK